MSYPWEYYSYPRNATATPRTAESGNFPDFMISVDWPTKGRFPAVSLASEAGPNRPLQASGGRLPGNGEHYIHNQKEKLGIGQKEGGKRERKRNLTKDVVTRE